MFSCLLEIDLSNCVFSIDTRILNIVVRDIKRSRFLNGRTKWRPRGKVHEPNIKTVLFKCLSILRAQ